MGGNILVIDQAFPTPDQDSGSASAISYLKILSEAGYALTFIPFSMEEGGDYAEKLHRLGIQTLSSPQYGSFSEAVFASAPKQDIFLLYRGPIASQALELCRIYGPRAKVCFHAVDLHFLREQRGAELLGDPTAAASAQATRVTELEMVRRADATIVVSEFEYRLLADLVPDANLHNIPILRPSLAERRWLDAVPWLSAARARSNFTKRHDLVFIGGYRHPPNVDAVRWFVESIWPRLLERGFAERFVVAGSHVPAEIEALAGDQIEVVGHVEQLGDLFARARASVAPLRYGGGIKGKVVTSLSYGVPVVGTKIAVEGMGMASGENVLVAETADDIAEQILRLYGDDALWHRISSAGREKFNRCFSIAAGAPQVLAVFEELMRR